MISVIITTYKRDPSFITRAMESVLSQTYRDIEIIIVDDSPQEYDQRENVRRTVLNFGELYKDIKIDYIQHDKNRGACAARNTGMEKARGEYIAYLDDDDEWMPMKLEKQIQVIKPSNCALVYCGYKCQNDTTGELSERKAEYHRGMVFDRLLYSNFIDSTSIPLIRTECLKSINGFDENMESAQDYDVWLRIAEKYEIDYVPESLVIYHEHSGEQITSNPNKKISGLERLNQKYKEYIDSNAKLWYRRNICITPYYSMIGEEKQAMRIWWKCIYKWPSNVIDSIRYFRLIIQGRNKRN